MRHDDGQLQRCLQRKIVQVEAQSLWYGTKDVEEVKNGHGVVVG